MTLQVIKAEDVRDGEPRWYCADQRHADEQIRDGLDGPLHLTDRGKEWFASWPLAIVDRPAPSTATQPPPVLDLDALAEAERAMTVGPWAISPQTDGPDDVAPDEWATWCEIDAPSEQCVAQCTTAGDSDAPNARGIAALRNAAPHLISEARAAVALRGEIAAYCRLTTDVTNTINAALGSDARLGAEIHHEVTRIVGSLREKLADAKRLGTEILHHADVTIEDHNRFAAALEKL